MDVSALKLSSLNNPVITIDKEGQYLLSLDEIDYSLKIEIKENVHAVFYFINNLQKPTDENSFLNININIYANANLKLNILNVSSNSCNFNLVTDLVGQNANFDLYSVSLLSKEQIDRVLINTKHKTISTFSNIVSYTVLKDKSNGFVQCISELDKGCSGSNAAQTLRLLVLDESAKANSDPILIINENDIVASHANAIGMLDPDQIFYLNSRGLTKKESETLIINGFFAPVLEQLKNINKEVYNDILTTIEKEI